MSEFTSDIKPGDIINIQGPIPVDPEHVVWDSEINIGIKIIEDAQKSVFCKVLDPSTVRWHDNHTMLYLGENKIFSCEPPKPTYHALGDFDAEPKRIMSIYRFNREFFGKTLDQDDLAIFKDGAEKIVGWNLKYDIGQLADILIDTFAKIPYKDEVHLFDADGGKEDKNVDIVKNKQHLVCSVAVAALIADWQRKLEEEKKDFTIREPWSMLNPAAWTEAFKKRYPGHWDCGSIFPAMFACTDTHFAGEFKHIGHYQGGYKIE